MIHHITYTLQKEISIQQFYFFKTKTLLEDVARRDGMLRDGTEFCTMYKVNGDFENLPFFFFF